MNKYIFVLILLICLVVSGCSQDLSSELKQELGVVEEKASTDMPMDEETQQLSDYALEQGYGSVNAVEELTKGDGTKIVTGKLEKDNTFLVKTTGPSGNESFIQEIEEKNGHLVVKKITEQGTVTIDLTTKEVINIEQ